MDSTQKTPLASERTDGSPAGGNGHHVWTVEEKEEFAAIMARSGMVWNRVTMEWVRTSESERPGAFAVEPLMHAALVQAGLGTLVLP
jgi:hypothetical protein